MKNAVPSSLWEKKEIPLTETFARTVTWILSHRLGLVTRGQCTAQRHLERLGEVLYLTALQSKILGLLGETGGAERKYLVEQLGISFIELEREIAALRHMEKVRGELREGKKFVTLW